MSNRRRRREQAQIDAAITAAAMAYRCPDCDADTEMHQLSPGIAELLVRHDDTCPAYRTMKGTNR